MKDTIFMSQIIKSLKKEQLNIWLNWNEIAEEEEKSEKKRQKEKRKIVFCRNYEKLLVCNEACCNNMSKPYSAHFYHVAYRAK